MLDIQSTPNFSESESNGQQWATPQQPGDVVIDVYDFFSGCGGTSAGLRKAGLNPVLAVDFDASALETFAHNFPTAVPILSDIRRLGTGDIEHLFDRERKKPVLICACAPCQPFSKQNRQKKPLDTRASLLSHLSRFVNRFRPELLLIENVPGLEGRASDPDSPLAELIEMLKELGYEYDTRIVFAHDYGVPQSRRRLIVVASLLGPIKVPQATHGKGREPHRTVKDAIGGLPPLKAGCSDTSVPNHQAANLVAINLERIRASRPGGNWSDWPEHLRLACHSDVDGYTDVYGRLDWNRPAPALTTRCTSYSNGRYGHPEQDRAISAREAACLQTFDRDFEFIGNQVSVAKQIGNAVPVRLAEAIGLMFKSHVAENLGGWHG